MNFKNVKLSIGALAFLSQLTLNAQATEYKVDTAHSSIGFKIRHLVSKVTGSFGDFDGSFNYDQKKPTEWKANATVKASSINTSNAKRDEHLKSPDFFNIEKFPTLTFTSTKITDIKGNKAKLHGDFTMLGVTKPLVLNLEIGGLQNDPQGNEKLGFSATGKLNRKDFGMIFNKILDKASLMLGEDVELFIEFEGAKVKS
jgi:polyisoprenoid-binding protein YceI